MKAVLLALFVAAIMGFTIPDKSQSARCFTRPVTTSVAATSSGQVVVSWTGVCGTLAKIKRDDYRQDPYHNRWYFEPNTGSAILVGQPQGHHTFRTCDISGNISICSIPVPVTVR